MFEGEPRREEPSSPSPEQGTLSLGRLSVALHRGWVHVDDKMPQQVLGVPITKAPGGPGIYHRGSCNRRAPFPSSPPTAAAIIGG